jgi:hypothetical protein
MVQITVSDDLARAISEAGAFVALIDGTGRTIGHVAPVGSKLSGPIGMTDEHIAELKRRMAEDDGTRYTWAEVKERLRALEQQ